MELLQQNWSWISANYFGAIGLVVLGMGLGWGAARLIYHERLELLKAKSDLRQPQNSPVTFSYPQFGRYGKNILANDTAAVDADQWVSMRTEVPVNSKLHIELRGPEPEYLDDAGGSWVYSVGHVVNWAAGDYDSANGGFQSFDTEGGSSDMKLRFDRPGVVRVVAYEGATQKISWERDFRVRATAKQNA